MSWNWLVIIAGMASLSPVRHSRPRSCSRALFLTCSLCVACGTPPGTRRCVRRSSGRALALVLGIATEAAAPWEPLASGRPIAGHLAYFSVLATLAALVSVLNARTPGAGGMGMVDRDARRGVPDSVVGRSGSRTRGQRPGAAAVAKSLEPLLRPAGVRRSDELLADAVRSRRALPRFGSDEFRPGVVRRCVRGAASAAVDGVSRRAVARGRGCAQWNARAVRRVARCDALWLWFRDHWGVVWALRVQDRFNRSAAAQEWPFRLSWEGLVNSRRPRRRTAGRGSTARAVIKTVRDPRAVATRDGERGVLLLPTGGRPSMMQGCLS